jgi:hypothetical protein
MKKIKYLNYYDFDLWVFDCLNLVKPKIKMSEVIDIVEYINPSSYEELAKMILMNSLIDVNDYNKNINIFNEIIKIIILSYENKNVNIYNQKMKLYESILDRRN